MAYKLKRQQFEEICQKEKKYLFFIPPSIKGDIVSNWSVSLNYCIIPEQLSNQI